MNRRICKILLSLILMSVGFTVYGQSWETTDSNDLRPIIKSIVEEFDTEPLIESANIGLAGEPSAQYKVFEKLYKQATEEELVTLTGHPNPAVRGYAFWGLAKTGSDKLEPILRKHIADTTTVLTMSGCSVGIEKVNSFMLDVVTPKLIDNCRKLPKRTIKMLREEMSIVNNQHVSK